MARMSAQDTLFWHCGTASRGAFGAEPDVGLGVRDAAAGGVPGERRPEGRHVHGPRKAGDLRHQYVRNLQAGKGLLALDQVLYTDPRSRPTVDAWAQSGAAFNRAFVTATGRVGVRTGSFLKKGFKKIKFEGSGSGQGVF
jgi:peroxidase